MIHRLTTFCLMIGFALCTLGGCETSEPGAKRSLFAVEKNFSGTTEEVTAAAHRALQDMKLTILENEATGVDGRVIGLTAQQDRVTVNVRRIDDQTSHVGVKVGAFGDTATSITILERIERYLAQ